MSRRIPALQSSSVPPRRALPFRCPGQRCPSASVRSSWASSTSPPIRSPNRRRCSIRQRPSTGRCRWKPTAPTSSTSAASRRGPAPRRCRPPRNWPRVLPVLRALAGRLRDSRFRSTPTRPRSRARRSSEGAALVNDVSGLRYEPALAGVVASAGAALVLMHMRGPLQHDVRRGGVRRRRSRR